jgi:uncharacterized protein YbjT (DUF2867 family)
VPQRILVLGASGYIGQHLTAALSQQGHQVLAAARNTERLQKLSLPGVTCHNVDLNWPGASRAAGRGRHALLPGAQHGRRRRFYRPRASGGDERPRCPAANAGEAGDFSKLAQAPEREQSDHLRARQLTADILRGANIPVTELRAGIIVGAGSAAFEVMRDMVYNLPVLTPPRWVRSRTTPIALENLCIIWWPCWITRRSNTACWKPQALKC